MKAVSSIMCNISFCLILSGCSESITVDLIVHNAIIYTVNDNFDIAQAMAIKDGEILEIGAEHQILNKYISSQTIDAQKAAVYPGFIDAHCHFLGFGLQQDRLDLVNTKSYNEVLERIANFTIKHGPWILGRGWDQNDWNLKSFPDNDSLDRLFPNLHIVLKRIDGHAMLVSQNVLDAAGITPSTKVPGGEILFEKGILLDKAMDIVESILPKTSRNQKSLALIKAQSDCLSYGITTVDDAGLGRSDIALINEMQNRGDLKIRIYAMISADSIDIHDLQGAATQTERLTSRSIKLYADGALGSRGAALISPYLDDITTGLMIMDSDSINQWAWACKKSGLQLNVHCIGDRANHITLTEMAKVLEGTNDLRWRIEHAQVIDLDDFSLFGRYNIIPSAQPTHATSDMYWAEQRLGAVRLKGAYAYKSLLDQNGMIALGTDFPVESINPFLTFHSAVFRKDSKGFPTEGFNYAEALTREECLKGMTIWGAISNFEELQKGSLEIGKKADFVILANDLMKCSEQEILNNYVLQTWINGELVYEK